METIIIKAKNKTQGKAVRAFALALEMECHDLDELEDKALGLLMKSTSKEYLSKEEATDFKNWLHKQ